VRILRQKHPIDLRRCEVRFHEELLNATLDIGDVSGDPALEFRTQHGPVNIVDMSVNVNAASSFADNSTFVRITD
jgi:hypothetical protein